MATKTTFFKTMTIDTVIVTENFKKNPLRTAKQRLSKKKSDNFTFLCDFFIIPFFFLNNILDRDV